MSPTTPSVSGNSATATSQPFPTVGELPTTEPQVILAFHGLMSMSFKSPGSSGNSGFCEVGVHDSAPNHDLRIKVFDLGNVGPNDKPEPIYTHNFGPTHPSPVDIIRIDAENASEPEVKFFHPINLRGGAVIPDPLDFALVNDFEGPNFYDRSLVKRFPLFRPRLIIKSGIFVTLLPTTNEFRRDAPFDQRELGQIAHIAGAGIYLRPEGAVGLRFGREQLRFPVKPTGNTLYLLLFDNSCPPEVCTFDPDSSIKERRNDFFEYYRLFEIPEDQEEFELRFHARTAPLPEPTGPGRVNYARVVKSMDPEEKFANNEAPCGPVAFGGG